MLRKRAIKIINVQKAIEEVQPEFERERMPKADRGIVMCSLCDGFFSRTFFSRHKRICKGGNSIEAYMVPADFLNPEKEMAEEYQRNVLCKFLNDDIGNMCRRDPVICQVGERLYNKYKRRKDKEVEVKKSVMALMRRMGGLFIHFKNIRPECGQTEEIDAGYMFKRENFKTLEMSIETFTAPNGNVKPGLKSGLFYSIKTTAQILKAVRLMDGNDEGAAEIDKFVAVFDMMKDFIFGDAIYQVNYNRQVKLRKPSELPLDEDVAKVRQYTCTTIQIIMDDPYLPWSSSKFIELRDLVVCRLTIFNARRGGEPARLTIKEWQDAMNGLWVDEGQVESIIDPVEKGLASQLKIAYQRGKGNARLVPVLITPDVVGPLNLLSEEEYRLHCGVRPDNHYLFACLQNSTSHVMGWHAVSSICQSANAKDKTRLTSTRNRHRVSTIFAAMDLPANEKEAFFHHMGHSKDINECVYQAPSAAMELTKVAKGLQKIDQGKTYL